MFLKCRGLVCSRYMNASRRLLSNDFKEVLNTRFDVPNESSGSHMHLSLVSKNLNAFNLDLLVNNLSSNDDRSAEVVDLIAKLRSSKLANTCLESTHFAIVRHLLENLSLQEMVPILLDRPKYGIFLNDFTSFAVTETLHKEKEYILGLPLALKLILAEEVDSIFVHQFCLKAALVTLNTELSSEQSPEEKPASPFKTKIIEKKIRVKFLRNVEPPDVHRDIGKAVLKIESKVLDGNIGKNAKILGLVLTKNYSELDKALSANINEIYDDIADICKKLLLRQNHEAFIDKIGNLQSKTSFENIIDTILDEASVKEPPTLAEKQMQLFPIWQQQRTQKQLEFEKEVEIRKRKENIEVTADEIAKKKDELWFFDNEDKLDLEIYNKRVFYPKRWFGKKKKPRVIDEHYVPPEIR